MALMTEEMKLNRARDCVAHGTRPDPGLDPGLYLLLMLEFQSTIDRWMALRFGTYVHLLYEQLVKEKNLPLMGDCCPYSPYCYIMATKSGLPTPT